MAEVRLRLNLDAEEVELVVDGKVATSTGPEVFRNWVEAYNDKHKIQEPEKKVDVDEPVEEKQVPADEEAVETPSEEVVDTPNKE